MSAFRRILFAVLLAALAAVVRADEPSAALSGTSFSAVLLENQKTINKELASVHGIPPDAQTQNPIGFYKDIYRKSNGGPIANWLGVPMSRITSSAAFKTLYWLVVLVAGIVCVMRALSEIKQSSTAPFEHMVAFFLKLFAGAVIVSQPALIYALLMTARDGLNLVVTEIVTPSDPGTTNAVATSISTGNLGTLDLDLIRNRAVQRGIDQRLAITQSLTVEERKQMGLLLNAMATALNSATGKPYVPIVPESEFMADDNKSPDSSHSISMAGQFEKFYLASASVDHPATIGVQSGGTTADITVLGSLINDAQRAPQKTRQEIMSLAQVPENRDTIELLKQRYEDEVFRSTKNTIDLNLGALIKVRTDIPGIAARLSGQLKQAVEDAASAVVAGPMKWIETALRAIVSAINEILARFIGRGANIVLNLILECNLALLVIIMPLWLLPATPRAFTGVVRSMFNVTLIMPTFQVLMFISDAIFGKILTVVSGAVLVGTIATPATGGLPLLAITLGYIVMYTTTVVILLFRTPKILNALFQGTGAVSAWLASKAVGMAAGALTAGGIVAAPAVGAKLGAFAAASKGVASGATSRVAAAIPASVRAGAQRLGYQARAAYSSLPASVRKATESTARGATTAARTVAQSASYRHLPEAQSRIPQAAAPAPATGAASAKSAAAPATPQPAQAAASTQQPTHVPVGNSPTGASKAEAEAEKVRLQSFQKPVRFALKKASDELVDAAFAEDPGDYLSRRKKRG